MGEEGDEIELDLALSIGGTYRKRDIHENFQEKSVLNEGKWDSRTSNSNEEARESVRVSETSSAASSFPTEISNDGWVLDAQRKREIQALRRQEAKKKRDEKQQKRLRERESANDNEIREEEPVRKKLQTGAVAATLSLPYPIMPLRFYPCPPLQYVPYSNGFEVRPHLMPRWAPEKAASVNEKAAFHPMADQRFEPLQGPNGNCKKTASNGSPAGSSSGVSNYQSSSSCHGGTSSEGRSRSSQSQKRSQQSNLTRSHQDVSSDQAESAYKLKRMESSNSPESSPVKQQQEHTLLDSSKRTISSTENPTHSPSKERKPPKPLARNPSSPSLPQMPYVSTTGNGPNGKTITGFLYRCTKTEVSIICVCHGTSFSPSEFVQHAGGTDVTHPLKHITVIPSAF